MKINDLARIDEQGITDWLAGKAGEWFNQKQQAGLVSKAANLADKAQQDAFYRNLGNALKSAETSGQVVLGSTPVPGKLNVKDFVKIYMDKGLKAYKIPPELNFDQNLADELDVFAQEYTGGGKLPRSTEKLWHAVQTVKSVAAIQQDGGGGGGGGKPGNKIKLKQIASFYQNLDPTNRAKLKAALDAIDRAAPPAPAPAPAPVPESRYYSKATRTKI